MARAPGLFLCIVAAVVGAGCLAGDPDPGPGPPKKEPGPIDPVQPDPPACDASTPNTLPATPVLTNPAPGRIDVDPSELTFAIAPFVDADGDAHARTELEIWRVRNGAADERVWRVSAQPGVLSATFADGTLDGEALDDGGLKEWKDYVVRARVGDDSEACATWSAWSADVSFRTGDGSDALFDPTIIRTFDITLPPASVDAINDEASPPGCVQFPRTAHTGTLTVDGQTFEGVGVRIKGGCGSSRNLDSKASLKVSLSWDDPAIDGCPVERRFHGQKTLTLNNGVQDPSAKHELMGYQLYVAAGVPAPRVAHAWVRVNGQDYGLYQLVESIDRRFLSRFYEDNNGMMYEGAYWCDIVHDNIPTEDGQFSCFQREFEADVCDGQTAPGSDPMDWQVLSGLATDLDTLGSDGFYPAVREVFDFDMFLSMWAVDAMLSHWDGYTFNIVNNYRIYHDPQSNLFGMFPWGIDQTFEMGGDQDPWQSSARMVNDCMQDNACDAAFAARLYEVATLFEALDYAAQADELHARLRPYVEQDPRKEYSLEAWDDRNGELRNWIAQRPARVRELLQNRGY